MAKFPKCGKEVALKKTWKMAGKPDKTGKRLELTIGLRVLRQNLQDGT